MKRFFYTDPLAAIWMAKHFGMKFSVVEFTGKSSGGKGDYSVRKEYTLYPSPFCNKEGLATCKTDRGGELIGSTSLFRFRNEFFVHPDSLPLLEPQPGDLCESNNGVPEICEAAVSDKEIGGNVMKVIVVDGFFRLRSDVKKIIQRNGIAFMSPESEEV